MKKITEKITRFIENFKNVHAEARKIGFAGVMRLIWKDLFVGRSLYREQWIFWIATNLFSIYLWWGENIHIQGMYWVYTLNSLVGWYQWTKAVKEG